jgi:hypothetical protein
LRKRSGLVLAGIKMNKQEILQLHTLSEEEQLGFLSDWDILSNRDMGNSPFDPALTWESLADCAFRLRDETIAKYGRKGWNRLLTVLKNEKIVDGSIWPPTCQPIHWIQAALLAKETGQ